MNTSQIVKIANNEITRIVLNPICIIIYIILVIFSFINLAGFTVYLSSSSGHYTYSEIFFTMIQNFTGFTISTLTFLSMCLVMITFAEERINGSLQVIIAKPIYRLDLILGKFTGINAFLSIISLFTMVLFISMMIIYAGAPEPIFDAFIRVTILTILICTSNILTVGITMLIVLFFKNYVESLILSLFYIIIERFMLTKFILNIFDPFKIIDPSQLLTTIRFMNPELLDLNFPFEQWLTNALPYIVLLTFICIIIILLDCMMFSKEEL